MQRKWSQMYFTRGYRRVRDAESGSRACKSKCRKKIIGHSLCTDFSLEIAIGPRMRFQVVFTRPNAFSMSTRRYARALVSRTSSFEKATFFPLEKAGCTSLNDPVQTADSTLRKKPRSAAIVSGTTSFWSLASVNVLRRMLDLCTACKHRMIASSLSKFHCQKLTPETD